MRVLIAVAHADDETLGCYSVLRRQDWDVAVLHATDSAPLDPRYAQKAGYATREQYRAARAREMEIWRKLAGLSDDLYYRLDIADQETPRHVQQIRHCVEAIAPERIYTHAYEGGHPDHDALAYALRGMAGVWEFPLYHATDGRYVTGEFLEGDAAELVALDEAEQARKQEWLGCFQTQSAIVKRFRLDRENFRPAPAYDFTRPPHAGPLYYESRGHGWTWNQWRAAVEQND